MQLVSVFRYVKQLNYLTVKKFEGKKLREKKANAGAHACVRDQSF